MRVRDEPLERVAGQSRDHGETWMDSGDVWKAGLQDLLMHWVLEVETGGKGTILGEKENGGRDHGRVGLC